MLSENIETRMKISHPERIQLYSAATANGVKVAAALEEIVEERKLKGDCPSVDYEPHTVRIRGGENKTIFFTTLNPSQKIPVIVDPNAVPACAETNVPENLRTTHAATVFESGAILLYLAERYGELIPKDIINRYQAIQWDFWGSSEFSVQCKQFGFYFKYCPHKLEYCENRAREKVTRLLDALERQLSSHSSHYIVGDMYTIADLAVWPWLWALYEVYDNCVTTRFGEFAQYPRVKEWYARCVARPASKKALLVCPFQDSYTTAGSKTS